MGEDPNSDVLTARVGKTVAEKYKLLRLLGAGGMGAVYEAENSWTQKRVALKLMLSDVAKNPDLSARFLREARAASRIEHPNVVQVLDMGQDTDGALFIVQEFLKGHDLRRLLDERQSLPPKEAVELIVPVMSALVAAHRHKIVHRDVKPENVFLVKSAGTMVPKVIDFGIAKMDEWPTGSLTKSGAAIGTPWYFSPEAARGERVDAQSDVWAVGIMLYEMLAGRCPWKTDTTYNALLFEIASAEIPRLDTISPKVPKALADVVHGALERDRTARYRTMGQFLSALLDCPLEDPGWRKTLRGSHETAMEKLGDTDPEDAFGNADTADVKAPPPSAMTPDTPVVAGVGPRTTLGQTAREVTTQATGGRRRWAVVAGVVAIAAVGVTAVWTFAGRGAGTRAASSVADAGVRRAVAASVPAASTNIAPAFTVSVTVRPSSAVIELDHENTGVAALVRQFPRDGIRHVLRASAPGYEPFAVEFVDAAPSPRIDLVAARVAATAPTSAARSTSRPRTAPAEQHAGPPPSTALLSPSAPPQPPERVVNGAPVVGE